MPLASKTCRSERRWRRASTNRAVRVSASINSSERIKSPSLRSMGSTSPVKDRMSRRGPSPSSTRCAAPSSSCSLMPASSRSLRTVPLAHVAEVAIHLRTLFFGNLPLLLLELLGLLGEPRRVGAQLPGLLGDLDLRCSRRVSSWAMSRFMSAIWPCQSMSCWRKAATGQALLVLAAAQALLLLLEPLGLGLHLCPQCSSSSRHWPA